MALTTEEQQALQGLLSGGVGALGTLAAANYGANQQNALANNLLATGQQAAQAAQFRPVGVTSRFGTSGFTYDDQGRLTGAGYQVAPDIAALRERLLGQAGINLGQATGAAQQIAPVGEAAQGLFQLGKGYLATSPEAAAQDWMQKQQALLQPGREQQLSQLTNQQFQRGRLGLGVGGTSGAGGSVAMGASNPELQAYYNAKAQQDAQLAAQAMQQGQAQTQFGAGLFSTGANLLGQVPQYQVSALAPFTNYIAGAGSIEGLGQNPMDVATKLGAQQSTSGAQVANILNTAAARAYVPAQDAATMKQQGLNSSLASFNKYAADPVAKLIASLTGGTYTGSPGGNTFDWLNTSNIQPTDMSTYLDENNNPIWGYD